MMIREAATTADWTPKETLKPDFVPHDNWKYLWDGVCQQSGHVEGVVGMLTQLKSPRGDGRD